MSHYRSIDIGFEEDEIIHFESNCGLHEYKLMLNGKSRLIISDIDTCHELIVKYLNSILFTGISGIGYAYHSNFVFKYWFKNGLIHREDGPAKIWTPENNLFGRGYKYYTFYKLGKPWYCLVNKTHRVCRTFGCSNSTVSGIYHRGNNLFSWDD